MLNAAAYAIRIATAEDEAALRRLAALSAQAPLAGRVMVGEIAGRPAAALSLESGRMVADPEQPTANLRVQLRMRGGGLRAAAGTPSLAARFRAAVQVGRPVGPRTAQA
jgi:hypothetical protein